MTVLEQKPLTLPVPLREDPPGVFRVGNTRVLLELVLRAYQRGVSPQDIVRMFDRHEPERLRLSGRATSKLGFGTGEAYVTFTETAPGHTVLAYDYAADVGGRLAAFGHRMLDGIVRMLLGSFFGRLRAHLRGEKQPGRLRAWLRSAWVMLSAKWTRR